MILAGDIGGTATRLALFETNGERVTIVAGATFLSFVTLRTGRRH